MPPLAPQTGWRSRERAPCRHRRRRCSGLSSCLWLRSVAAEPIAKATAVAATSKRVSDSSSSFICFLPALLTRHSRRGLRGDYKKFTPLRDEPERAFRNRQRRCLRGADRASMAARPWSSDVRTCVILADGAHLALASDGGLHHQRVEAEFAQAWRPTLPSRRRGARRGSPCARGCSRTSSSNRAPG